MRAFVPAFNILPLLVLASLLASCSTTLEATLVIETVGVERVETQGSAELHPLGDKLKVPAEAQQAFLKVGDGEEIQVRAGDEIALIVEDAPDSPDGVSTVLLGGKEISRRAGRQKVAVRWASVERRELLPKTEEIELELEPGQEMPIDRTVMYVPMQGSRFEAVETRVRLSGTDAEELRWVESEPPRNGRVRGKVVAPKE